MSRADFPEVISALLDGDRLPELGPGSPARDQRDRLAGLSPGDLGPVTDTSAARACLAGLWLHFDFLDESHDISQALGTPEGSYWHGLMHRREPDAPNATYWMRRVGGHPIHDELSAAARGLAEGVGELAALATGDRWDAAGFIDLCERHRGAGGAAEQICRQVQLAEWHLLFGHCQRLALGG